MALFQTRSKEEYISIEFRNGNNVTIGANSSVNPNLVQYGTSYTLSDYKPIGIISYATGAANVFFRGIDLDDISNVRIDNITSSSVTINANTMKIMGKFVKK